MQWGGREQGRGGRTFCGARQHRGGAELDVLTKVAIPAGAMLTKEQDLQPHAAQKLGRGCTCYAGGCHCPPQTHLPLPSGSSPHPCARPRRQGLFHRPAPSHDGQNSDLYVNIGMDWRHRLESAGDAFPHYSCRVSTSLEHVAGTPTPSDLVTACQLSPSGPLELPS